MYSYTSSCNSPNVSNQSNFTTKFSKANVGLLKSTWLCSDLGPAMVVLQTADGERDHFDPAFAELAAQPCSPAQLGGADGCVVSGVGEQDSPPGMKTASEAVPRVR